MNAAAYVRVSSEGQATEDKTSLLAQREAIASFAHTNKHRIVATFEDAGASGVTADRPALNALMIAAAHGTFDTVFVYKLCRLARSNDAAGHIRYMLSLLNVSVLSVSEQHTNGDGELAILTRSLGDTFATIERKRIVDRLKLGREKAKQRGLHIPARVPFGFTVENKRLVADTTERRWIARMRRWARNGQSQAAIAELLNEHGVKPRYSPKWTQQIVSVVLRRPRIRHRLPGAASGYVPSPARADSADRWGGVRPSQGLNPSDVEHTCRI